MQCQLPGAAPRRRHVPGAPGGPGRRLLDMWTMAFFGKISAKCCSFLAVSAPIFARTFSDCSILRSTKPSSGNFKIWQHFPEFFQPRPSEISPRSQNLQNFANFQIFQVDNLVDFEKCCKTRIFMQKSVPILPKTSNILPKFCQKMATTLRVRRAEACASARAGRESCSEACASPSPTSQGRSFQNVFGSRVDDGSRVHQLISRLKTTAWQIS